MSLYLAKFLKLGGFPDDEILGCGGSIIKLKKTHKIQTVFLTNGVSSRNKSKKNIIIRKNEALKLFKNLKINKPIFLDLPDNQLDKISLLTNSNSNKSYNQKEKWKGVNLNGNKIYGSSLKEIRHIIDYPDLYN